MQDSRSFNVEFNGSIVTTGYYQSFMALDKFLDSKNGFLVNDACIIVDEVFLNNNNASLGRELIDFKGVGKIERDYVELVEKAC
ncbi:hypothetical protein Ahy_A02g005835 isoform B [Arachis hypogaea]|uniref:MATH domain-containing protein n=1 Tax=Arachis hypogaea TaxID=3818 RepID=A0A445E855_ARAHY|nr:hypothetical protein Ahy_A02g005835 isoform B [Arachis hypogaea]